MSKYDPLRHYLEQHRGEQMPMTFAEVERLLGFALPPSARAHATWWSNNPGTHVGVRAWRDAGFKTSRVDIVGEKVVFVRVPENTASRGFSEQATAPFRREMNASEMVDPVTFDRAKLGITSRRILDDYTSEAGGDVQAALDKALHEARIAFRQRLINGIPRGTPSSVSSADLIREDRDAR